MRHAPPQSHSIVPHAATVQILVLHTVLVRQTGQLTQSLPWVRTDSLPTPPCIALRQAQCQSAPQEDGTAAESEQARCHRLRRAPGSLGSDLQIAVLGPEDDAPNGGRAVRMDLHSVGVARGPGLVEVEERFWRRLRRGKDVSDVRAAEEVEDHVLRPRGVLDVEERHAVTVDPHLQVQCLEACEPHLVDELLPVRIDLALGYLQAADVVEGIVEIRDPTRRQLFKVVFGVLSERNVDDCMDVFLVVVVAAVVVEPDEDKPSVLSGLPLHETALGCKRKTTDATPAPATSPVVAVEASHAAAATCLTTHGLKPYTAHILCAERKLVDATGPKALVAMIRAIVVLLLSFDTTNASHTARLALCEALRRAHGRLHHRRDLGAILGNVTTQTSRRR
mmetsp:Transcript_27828/g.62867  ORF Transcript_27828/g.62867 Transcript_27828/m.62867 type:complete len:393 (+) Transcript_27828:51-1229(+)